MSNEYKTKEETVWSSRIYISNNDENFLRKRERQKLDFDSLSVTTEFPKNALIELTSGCNHSCVFCANPRMMRKGKRLDMAMFEKFLSQAVPLGLEEIGFYTTGEPLVRKDLIDFVKMSSDHGVGYIYITTNGALADIERMKSLISAGLNSIKFSINAGDRETYRLIHGKDDFDKVLKNLRDLKAYRDSSAQHVRIMASFIVTKSSEDEIELFKEKVVPYVDDAKIAGVHGQMGQSLDQLKNLESYLTTTYPKEGQAEPCHMLWDRVHLTQEGLLTLCCVDYENNLVYADLNKTSLKDAWNNSLMKEMRRRHIDRNLKGALCHNCVYGKSEKFKPISNIWKPGEKNQKNSAKGEKSVIDRINELIDQKRKKK